MLLLSLLLLLQLLLHLLPMLLRAQLAITWLCCVFDVDHKRLNSDLARPACSSSSSTGGWRRYKKTEEIEALAPCRSW
jgi:hypothetical protein